MFEVYWTHIAISDNLDAMGLAGSKAVHAIHQGNHKKQCQQGWKPTAQSHIHWDVHPTQPKMQPATSVVKLDIRSQDAMEVHQRSHQRNHQRKGKVEGKR